MAARAFLKIENIPGTSNVEGHPDEIEVEGWSFGIMHPHMYGQSTGEAQVQSLCLSFQSGTHSALMFQSVALGTVAPTLTLITETNDRGKKPIILNKIELKNCVIESWTTGFQHTGSSVSLSESITVTGTQIAMETSRLGSDNATKASYNLRVNKLGRCSGGRTYPTTPTGASSRYVRARAGVNFIESPSWQVTDS